MSDQPQSNPDNPEEPRIDGQFLLDFFFRLRRYGVLMIFVGMVLMIGLVVYNALNAEPLPPLNFDKIGVHMLLDDGRNNWDVSLWDEHMRYAGQMSGDGGIAVQVIRHDDLDAEKWQKFLDLARDNNLTPVLRLATTFDFDNNWWFAPDDYTQWATDFSEFLNALTWHTDEKYLILLNEPNNGHEWGGEPSPADYAEFSVTTSEILRQNVGDVRILNAAFDLHAPDTGNFTLSGLPIKLMDADTFMTEMESAVPDIFDTYDIWNSHPYPLHFIQPPSVQIFQFDVINDAVDDAPTPPDGIYNRGINGYEWELWKLRQLGYSSEKPIMITEFGWRTDSDLESEIPSQVIAQSYYDLALLGRASIYQRGDLTWMPLLADERIIAIAPFALNGHPDEWEHTSLLEMTADGDVLGTTKIFDRLAGYQSE